MTVVKIINKDGWMGHPKGSIVDLSEVHADSLVKRKTAKKAVKAPSKNKMVKATKNK